MGLADVYVQLGDEMGERALYEDALEQLNKIVKIGIPNKEEYRFKYYFLRGLTNVKLGNWKKAKENFKKCGEDPEAKRIIRRIENNRIKEVKTPKTIFIGGLFIAVISLIGLILSSVQYFCSFANITQIDAQLYKVLVPAFLFFSVVGFSLPFIRSIKGPGGIGFEKDIPVSSELSSDETIRFEPHLLDPNRFSEKVYIPESRPGDTIAIANVPFKEARR
ncbi:MAG: hypothetical protein HOG49_42060 [Candidatus Scalindua sp.]|nr:hypothetical protein [Candidatus Scalindua sp.]